jgi:hypothetical protein
VTTLLRNLRNSGYVRREKGLYLRTQGMLDEFETLRIFKATIGASGG